MDENQLKNFKKFINHESKIRYTKFINDEIEAQPDNIDFLTGLLKSTFFQSFFERGFMEGITFEKENKDTKYVF